jgi:hypothetical protein
MMTSAIALTGRIWSGLGGSEYPAAPAARRPREVTLLVGDNWFVLRIIG